MAETKELIVLVHGFGAKRLAMWPLAQLLRVRGFRVQQWSYVSYFAPIETHASRLFHFVSTSLSTEKRFHIVAHSMGSIIVQSALNRGVVPNLGRLVLLAPPNRGSPVARRASSWLGGIVTPMNELSDASSSFVNQLTRNATLDVGVIAARYDLLVPIANTHLENESAHTVVTATHNSLLISRRASNLTTRFLTSGFF
jgi:alpha-beta hydrolase superfamily lysophospholipase